MLDFRAFLAFRQWPSLAEGPLEPSMHSPSRYCYLTLNQAVNQPLRQNFLHHISGHVGEAEVATAVAIGQAFVIDSQKVQDSGM